MGSKMNAYKNGKIIFCTSFVCCNFGCVYRKPKRFRSLLYNGDIILKPFLKCKDFK